MKAPASIAWRRLDSPGHDAAVLRAVSGGWQLEGAAVFVESGLACHLRYEVTVDRGWHTRAAIVQGWRGSKAVDLRLDVTEDQRWLLNGQAVAAVAGAIDIDLAFTPATNLLPIRRLGLEIGATARVDAAWLRFPELDLRRLDQVYRRVGSDTYLYSSQGGTFTAPLTVSAAGFVTTYPGLWVEER